MSATEEELMKFSKETLIEFFSERFMFTRSDLKRIRLIENRRKVERLIAKAERLSSESREAFRVDMELFFSLQKKISHIHREISSLSEESSELLGIGGNRQIDS